MTDPELATATDHAWIVITAIFAGATLALYLAREVVPPVVRHLRMIRPCKAWFVITSYDRGKVDYAVQDENEHLTRQLIVPSHSKVYVQVMLETRLAFTQLYIVFGFDRREYGDRAPLIDHYKLQFIKVGKSEKFPGEDEGHWTDHHDAYHITEERRRVSGQRITYGFIVKTRDLGSYRMRIEIGAESENRVLFLDVVVDDHDWGQRMRCVEHSGCLISRDPSAKGILARSFYWRHSQVADPTR